MLTNLKHHDFQKNSTAGVYQYRLPGNIKRSDLYVFFFGSQQETTSLAERIRLLTWDVEDEPEERSSAVISSDKMSDKSYNSIDKNSEKAFGSASSSSSSSTLSAPVPTRQQPPDLGDVHQESQKIKVSAFYLQRDLANNKHLSCYQGLLDDR